MYEREDFGSDNDTSYDYAADQFDRMSDDRWSGADAPDEDDLWAGEPDDDDSNLYHDFDAADEDEPHMYPDDVEQDEYPF